VKRPVVSIPPELGYWACRVFGLLVRDVIITRQEIRGLMEGRLYVDAPPLGATKLTEWIGQHKDTLGRHYTSEMARRVDRFSGYKSNWMMRRAERIWGGTLFSLPVQWADVTSAIPDGTPYV
jgi:hypothetical protein